MKNKLIILIVVVSTIIFSYYFINCKEQIDSLNNGDIIKGQIQDSLTNIIDSLQNELKRLPNRNQ